MSRFDPTDETTPEGKISRGLKLLREAQKKLGEAFDGKSYGGKLPDIILNATSAGFSPWCRLDEATAIFQTMLNQIELHYRRQEDAAKQEPPA